MRTVFFDCYAGVSGDMIVGALLNLGVDIDSLGRQIETLGLTGYQLSSEPVKRAGVAATKFNVTVDENAQPRRGLSGIKRIINNSELSATAKSNAIRVFERLAEAEARVHGATADSVHFHEVGAVDSIVDIAGAMIGFEMLDVQRFHCSPLRVGYGMVKTEHGVLPVPAPATVELLKGKEIYAGDVEGEFVTPTGAAIVATLCEPFGPLPKMMVNKIGYGAGSRDPRGFSNALRLILGEDGAQDEPEAPGEVVVIETNIDDMSPQVYGFVMERAFALGALDVFTTPVQMKKGRPGVLLTILCAGEKLDRMADLLIKETTTLGVRYYAASRRVLDRRVETVQTEYGSVRVKVALERGREIHSQPEYEDCAQLAEQCGAALIEVQAAAAAAFRNSRKAQGPDGELET